MKRFSYIDISFNTCWIGGALANDDDNQKVEYKRQQYFHDDALKLTTILHFLQGDSE